MRLNGHSIEVDEYFASLLCNFELQRFGLAVGNPAGQALWEALVIVVAAMAWKGFWSQTSRTSVSVKSDGFVALNAARKLSSSDPKLNAVMQELALLVAVHGLNINLIEHTPGLANILPDRLSREHQLPGWSLPKELRNCRERVIFERYATWWVARGPPAHAPHARCASVQRPVLPPTLSGATRTREGVGLVLFPKGKVLYYYSSSHHHVILSIVGRS